MTSHLFKSAWINIRRRPMQSFLTILQVALAVACMVSVASYRMNVSAAVARFKSSIEDIVIATGGTRTRTSGGYSQTIYNIFDDDDIAELNAEASLVEAVTPYEETWGTEADVDGMLYRIGPGALVGPGYQYVANLDMTEGNFITAADLESRSRVAVVSDTLAKILFGDGPYVGRTLGMMPRGPRANSADDNGAMPVAATEYQVIGVFSDSEARTRSIQMAGNASILLPFTASPHDIQSFASGAGWARNGEEYPYGTLMIKAAPGKAAAVRDRIIAMVSGRPRPDSSDSGGMVILGTSNTQLDGPESDGGSSSYRNSDEGSGGASVIFEQTEDFEQMVGSSMRSMTLLLGGATLIAIIVSALGIQSAMMVNTTARTREIGLRRVLGASRGSVVAQFTVDAMMLGAVGGVFGGLLSFALYPYLVSSVFSSMGPGWLLEASARPAGWAIFAGIVGSAAIGALFGAIPAAQAARVQPADVMTEL